MLSGIVVRSTVKLKCCEAFGISSRNPIGKHHKSLLSSLVLDEGVTGKHSMVSV